MELINGYRLILKNRDYALGYYYHEDDWSLEAVGRSFEECVLRIIPKYISREKDFDLEYVNFFTEEYIEHNDEPYVHEDYWFSEDASEDYKDQLSDICNIIKAHPEYKRLKRG